MKILNISKTYQNKQVVQPTSIHLHPNSCLGLLGSNGAGKSTLIKLLLGLTLPDNNTEAKIYSDKIAYLPELPYLPKSLTARQIVMHAAAIHQVSSARVEEILNLVSLHSDYWDKPTTTFSKGMQQRTAIAFALVGNTPWLILDEPMSGLDALGRREILDIIIKLKGASTGILMCSHSVPDLVRACDHVAIMAHGKIHETITIHEHSLKEAEQLENRLAELSQRISS